MRQEIKNYKRTGAGISTCFLCMIFISLFGAFLLSSCEKNTTYVKPVKDPITATDVIPPVINSVTPSNNAVSVPAGTNTTVTFSEKMNPSSITPLTFTLKQGSTAIPGTVTSTGAMAVFTPSAALSANKIYTATVSTEVKDSTGNSLSTEYTWSFTTAADPDTQRPTVVSVVPANNATAIPTNTKVTVTFSEAMNATTISSSTVTVKKGSTAVAGTVSYTGTVATFTPSSVLDASAVYTGTVTTGVKDVAGNALATVYTWSFTTATTADATPPTVLSVIPAANSTSIATGTKATATFSESMDAGSINTTTFTLKQGSAVVPGTVTFSGTTATFTPTSALAGSTVFTATVTTGAKDASGNAMTANYTWSFTTAVSLDVTAPAIASVTPANNSTSIAVDAKPTATFSENMNSGTITTSTFSLKQGSTSIAGTVTYSGTKATFTPSANLTSGTVYTCTITTGAKDVAGNSVSANYTWSFTTIAASSGKSFSADVVPVLNLCNTCHTHNWTTSSNASTFYTNLVNGGYVKPSAPTTSKIFTKISGGHPSSTVTQAQKTTVLTWFNEGALNN